MLTPIVLGVVIVSGGVVTWWVCSKSALPPGFARGNGRLEAKEVDVPTACPGRQVPALTELSALEQTQGDQLVAVVNLYNALGGSWKRKDEEWRAPK